MALMVGLRFFERGVLETLFREELTMLKEVEFIRDLFADDLAEARAQGQALGQAQGQALGQAQGQAEASRHLVQALLERRFGELPASVVAHVEQASPAECEALALRLLEAHSLAELGLPENDPAAP